MTSVGGSNYPDLRQALGDPDVDADLLERALTQLTPEHRAVVELTYYHDCPYREIATILDCPVDTVKTRMFYARRRLRDLLGSHRKDLPWLDESSSS